MNNLIKNFISTMPNSLTSNEGDIQHQLAKDQHTVKTVQQNYQ